MMEKHKCKLCLRSFSNGRALGGHMRSHMMNYPLPTKPQASSSRTIQLSFEADSASSSSSEENSDNNNNNNIVNNNDDKGVICYGLRENPKRSFRLEDPEFSSMILQDRESETESYKNRKWYETSNYRSRMRDDCNNDEGEAMMKKIKLLNKGSKIESWVVDHEPLMSSVSDVSTEEDVAFCLMMMSRDNRWKRQKDQEQEQLMKNDRYYDYDKEEDEMERFSDEQFESDASSEEESRFSKNKVRGGRYKCETCNKVFRSYQALGGHRASHKRMKVKISRVNNEEQELENENGGSFALMVVEKKIHEPCPICLRVFGSGQALGGHKRTHVIGSTTIIKSTQVSISTKHGNNFIDLNLPAQGDNGDDDINPIENSAVSDADFVKIH
ncbi:PREDICTED: zinc finger protein ZAT9-like isoform X2 [Lupinus angustifolius]|uniref:zinc finger protein ZAT9-like isoform X2 n=1 Tax=Lupinus angustifolius TaxID=3871 RepID=UPI00092ED379|nr:PREDICTED: zinc finger protein ZAT9-like isoform X2 [Lupinus angustifolius]